MTQNDIMDKQDGDGRRAFLGALYRGSPDNLYLELRCIHPTTGEVRSLWGKMGNKRELGTVLKAVEKLNREGYGVYFAPCLRKTREGKAEAAALVPGLWIDIDCDGNALERERALEKLRAFNPPSSAIVDSGGGLHAYWFFETPYLLEDGVGRDKIAALLRGLFSALGGDEAYVKTVAGIMRLPQTVNTKKERGGAQVHIIELYPERRYESEAFEWLAVAPKVERVGALNVVTLNPNGHHPLPPRTETYLSSGTAHHRNHELFHAACQLRDAGYLESEAEAELLPRYLADGNSSESGPRREREGQATIRSAYSRPRRDPITAHRKAMEGLRSRYGKPESERPTVAEVREAVKACAALDPLEWAEERKTLKDICGDTFKSEDLNRMYREARKGYEREAVEAFLPKERYLEVDGMMIHEYQTSRGTSRKVVAPWVGRVLENITQVVDEGECEQALRLQLRLKEKVVTLTVPSELFGDPNSLQRFIAAKAGGIFVTNAGMTKHLVPAINALSSEAMERQTYRFMGWTEREGGWTYIAPQVSLREEGLISEPPQVELETRLRDYRLREGTWEDGLNAFRAALQVFPKQLAPALIAFTLLPLIQRFYPTAAARPAVHLIGTTGSGKSEIAALMTSFYGDFTRDTPPAQWGDTVNAVELLGYTLADALYWVDDFKTVYADEKTFIRFLHSYSKGMGRSRLTKDSKLRDDKPCRGLLLSTGETKVEGEAALLSRMLVLEIPPWEKRDPGGKRLMKAEGVREHLPVFTAHFAQWLAGRANAGMLQKKLSAGYEESVRGYRDLLRSKGVQQANTGRMISSWAVLVTTYRLIREFLVQKESDDDFPAWQDNIVEGVQAVQEERAGKLFVESLSQLLASGAVALGTNLREGEEPRPGTVIVGYQDKEYVYLFPEVAFGAVNRVQPLRFTAAAIGSQLKEDGMLFSNGNDTHLGVQIRIRGTRVRVWRLRGDILSGDKGDSGDSGKTAPNV